MVPQLVFMIQMVWLTCGVGAPGSVSDADGVIPASFINPVVLVVQVVSFQHLSSTLWC